MLSNDSYQGSSFSKENYFDHLLNLTPSSVYWKDLSGIYLGCNLSMLGMVGLSSLKEIIGKTDYDLPWRGFADTLKKNDREVVQFGKLLHFEETGMLANGNIIVVISNKMPLVDQSGNVVGIIGSSIDITAIKQAERAKQKFLQDMAHDLRTPLAGIIGLSSLQAMGDTNTPEKIKTYGQMICGASEQLLELFNTVIQVIETEHMIDAVQTAPLDLLALARELQTLMEPSVHTKGLQFHLKLDARLPIVLSDRIKLKRVLLNLLSNAVKFTKQGKVSLTITLLSIKHDQAKVEIRVADTGIGIAKDSLDKIFDHFYRGHPSHRAEYSGYGIGLYLVKTALQSLGGNIEVFSNEGQGACFTLQFDFPVYHQGLDDVSDIMPIKSVAHIQSTQRTILLAEDNTLVLHATKKILENANYNVIVVTDGITALHALQTKSFAWALLDIGLSKMKGIEVTKHYRQWEQERGKSRLPIFAFTAHGLHEVTENCRTAGMDHVFSKPFTSKDLQTIIQYL